MLSLAKNLGALFLLISVLGTSVVHGQQESDVQLVNQAVEKSLAKKEDNGVISDIYQMYSALTTYRIEEIAQTVHSDGKDFDFSAANGLVATTGAISLVGGGFLAVGSALTAHKGTKRAFQKKMGGASGLLVLGGALIIVALDTEKSAASHRKTITDFMESQAYLHYEIEVGKRRALSFVRNVKSGWNMKQLVREYGSAEGALAYAGLYKRSMKETLAALVEYQGKESIKQRAAIAIASDRAILKFVRLTATQEERDAIDRILQKKLETLKQWASLDSGKRTLSSVRGTSLESRTHD